MFKMLIHNIKKYEKIFLKWFFILIVSFFVLSFCNADLLDHSLRKISKDIDGNSTKKSVVKDIYTSSLNQKKYDELQAISDAVSSTKSMLNSLYCMGRSVLLTDQDIINILYYADSSFRSEVDSLTVSTLSKPKYWDMTWSCLAFNKCVWKSFGKSSMYLTWDYGCLKQVPSAFEKINTDKTAVSTLTDKLEWSEYFWNGSLDDSKFDLLSDVYDIAKLLFSESQAQEPPETVFFDMPTLSNTDGVYHDPNVITSINWFWPHNITGYSSQNNSSDRWRNPYTQNTQTWSSDKSNLNRWDAPSETSFQWEKNNANDRTVANQNNKEWNNANSLNVKDWKIKEENNVSISREVKKNIEWIDQDIENFITTVNSTEYESDNARTFSMWNDCASWFSYQYSSIYTVTETWLILWWMWWTQVVQDEVVQQTVDEYLEEVLEQVQALQCNNDYVCDSWESSTCPDCVGIFTWDTTSDEVSNMLNELVMEDGEEVSQQTLLCFDKCLETQKTSDTKLLCVAKCFCTDVWSDVGVAWMTSSFRLKFCVVPAIWQKFQMDNGMYSVWELFNEMNDLVSDLKNQWNTLSTVKTKSFFDSSYVKNNFAKQLSFSIVTEQKNQVSQKTKKAKDDGAKSENSNLSNAVLWFSEKANVSSEKNKYIVAQEYVLSENIGVTSNEEIQNLNESLQNQTVILVDSKFEKFMQVNSEFWSEIKSVLESFNAQSNILKSKPKS